MANYADPAHEMAQTKSVSLVDPTLADLNRIATECAMYGGDIIVSAHINAQEVVLTYKPKVHPGGL